MTHRLHEGRYAGQMRCLFARVSLCVLLIACSGSEGTTTAGVGGGGGASGGAGGASSAGGGGEGGCTPQSGVTPGPDWVCVTEVRGEVIDEGDAPVSDVLMTVCGPGGCEPDESDASGAFTIDVGFPIFVDDWSTIPHGRELGKLVYYFAFDAEEPGPVIDLGTIRLLDAPAGGAPLIVKTDDAGAPAQTVVHDGVTLTVPAGVRVNLDFDDVSLGDEGKLFRARAVPSAFMNEFVDPALSAAVLYALTPFDARFDLESDPGTDAKVTLSFTNTTGLAADTPVELLQLGSFIVGDLEAGDYAVVATGAVSADGTTIEMDPGEGVTFLTWIAIRAAG